MQLHVQYTTTCTMYSFRVLYHLYVHKGIEVGVRLHVQGPLVKQAGHLVAFDGTIPMVCIYTCTSTCTLR